MNRRTLAIQYAEARAMRRDAINRNFVQTALSLTLYIQSLRKAWKACLIIFLFSQSGALGSSAPFPTAASLPEASAGVHFFWVAIRHVGGREQATCRCPDCSSGGGAISITGPAIQKSFAPANTDGCGAPRDHGWSRALDFLVVIGPCAVALMWFLKAGGVR